MPLRVIIGDFNATIIACFKTFCKKSVAKGKGFNKKSR